MNVFPMIVRQQDLRLSREVCLRAFVDFQPDMGVLGELDLGHEVLEFAVEGGLESVGRNGTLIEQIYTSLARIALLDVRANRLVLVLLGDGKRTESHGLLCTFFIFPLLGVLPFTHSSALEPKWLHVRHVG